jgi:hypothetical protein
MREPDRAHLQEVVDALVAAGNTVYPPGFHPSQAGWICEMTQPLDPAVATASAAADARLTYINDELSCSHCWAGIIGGHAISEIARRRTQPPE